VVLLAATRLRRSELLALRWEDVDLDGRVLTVTGSVAPVKGQGLVRQDRTKGGDERSVPLPQFAVDALHRRKGGRQGPNTVRVIFPSFDGHTVGPGQLRKAVARGTRVPWFAGRVVALVPKDSGHID
jgi:integrase